jgi:hypothetical protein
MRRNDIAEKTRITLRGRNLLKRRRIELHRVHAQVKGTTTSINDDHSLALRILFLIGYPRRGQVPDAEMKTRFTFRQKTNASTSIGSARDEPSKLDRTSNLLLLGTLPAIRMGKDEPDLVLDRSPYILGVRFLNVCFGASKEVFYEIRQNVDNSFAFWKRWNVVVLDVCG